MLGVGDARRAVAKARQGRVCAGHVSCDQDDPSAQCQIRVGTMPEGIKLGLVASRDRRPGRAEYQPRVQPATRPQSSGCYRCLCRTYYQQAKDDGWRGGRKCQQKTMISRYAARRWPPSLPAAPELLYWLDEERSVGPDLQSNNTKSDRLARRHWRAITFCAQAFRVSQ